MKKVFLFLIMFFIVGAYGNNGAIESSITQHETPVIIQTDWSLNEDYEEPRSEEAENLHAWQIEPLTDEKIAAREAYYKDKRDNS